jgi:hypothetical protein
MKLEDNIAKSIKDYPSLFKDSNWEKSRIKVLDHLFLTIGNGFEWTLDGYLAESVCKKKGRGFKKPEKYGKEKFSWRPDQSWFDSKIYGDVKWEKEIEALIKENPKFSGLLSIEERSDYIPTPYPVCEYSAIITAPENIKLDWLLGAIETAEWAKSFYDGPPQQVMKSNLIMTEKISELSVHKHVNKQLKIICKALTRLNLIKKTLYKI